MTGAHFTSLMIGAVFAAGALEIGDTVLPDPISGSAYVDGPVRAGDATLVHWDIDKRTDCPGMTSRVWSGEGGFQLSEQYQPTTLPKGKGDYAIQTDIPELAPPGDLDLHIEGFFECDNSPRRYFKMGPVEMEVVE